MVKRFGILFVPALLLTSGCASTEPLEEQIRELSWKLDASEQSAEQSTIDARLAEREKDLALKKNRVLKEQLALAYDALREARTRLDEGIQERITELSEAGPGERLSVSQYGGVVLESGVLFRPGSHTLTTAGEDALLPLCDALKGQDYAAYDIELSGHTDSDPIKHSKSRYRDNWDLGGMRANSVRRFLVEHGVSEERVHLSAWGPTRPINPGEKKPNRRVEIVLRPRDEDGKTLPASAPRQD